MTQNNFQIDSAAVSDKGLSKKRPQNEDSFLELNGSGLFAVADGVGGAQAGEVASQMAVETLSEAFANLRENGDAEELMRVAIERANTSIYQMAHDLPQLATMATTVVALYISGDIATIGHVGDSRLYRLDTAGKLHRETGDHSVVEEEVRAGRMTSEQAANHPSRNVISRALGADSTVEVDTKTIMFEPNTTFLLCSDGITRHIDDAQLRELLLSGDTLSGITSRMKEICYERGAEDNLTAVIARVTDTAAGHYAPEKSESAAEFEEPTVTTARRAALIIDNSRVKTSASEEIPTGELSPSVERQAAKTERILTTETLIPELVSAPVAPQIIEKNETIAETAAIEKVETVPGIVENKIETNGESNRRNEGGSRFLGKLLSALMWIILGGILGAGLYYLFLQNNKAPEAPVSAGAPAGNIEYAAFENNRRAVDKNPRQYISTNSAAPVNDAESAYLLGRAYLLNGQFTEARQMFLQAKERLGQIKETSGRVITNDIEAGLVISGTPSAQEEFKRALNLSGTSDFQTNTNPNMNADAAPNANTVNR